MMPKDKLLMSRQRRDVVDSDNNDDADVNDDVMVLLPYVDNVAE